SSSRIGLKASRRMRKLATRMATSPMASRPSKDGNLVRPEKFRVISGPLTAPAAMMALFATTTFWKVVRFRCHHRGSNEILTIHSRHRSETNLNSMPESVQAGAQSGARRMPGADHPAANWVEIRVRRSSLPLFCGPFPQRPAFFFTRRKPCGRIAAMASRSFDFEQVTRVTAGAIGDPGKRAFYLQLRTAGELISLALEKDQLRTLTERLQEVFSRVSVPPADRLPEMALEEPINPVWRVGFMTLTYSQEEKLFEVSLVELVEGGAEPATGH